MSKQEFGVRGSWAAVPPAERVDERRSTLPVMAAGLLLVGMGMCVGIGIRPLALTDKPSASRVGQEPTPRRVAPKLTPAQLDDQRQAAEAEETRLDTIARQKKAAALLAQSSQDESNLVRGAAVAKEVIAGRMRDPSSLIFRSVIATEAGTYFCGEVNGRNGLGGYGEWTPFIAVGHSVYFPDSPIFASTFESACVKGWGKQAAPF